MDVFTYLVAVVECFHSILSLAWIFAKGIDPLIKASSEAVGGDPVLPGKITGCLRVGSDDTGNSLRIKDLLAIKWYFSEPSSSL